MNPRQSLLPLDEQLKASPQHQGITKIIMERRSGSNASHTLRWSSVSLRLHPAHGLSHLGLSSPHHTGWCLWTCAHAHRASLPRAWQTLSELIDGWASPHLPVHPTRCWHPCLDCAWAEHLFIRQPCCPPAFFTTLARSVILHWSVLALPALIV